MLDSIKGMPAPGAGNPASASAEAAPETLSISLKPVLGRLPVALKPLVTRPASPDEKIGVPTAKVLAQLSTGAVRITFEELRSAAPAGLFSAGGQGDALVDLPLPDILRVAGPLLKRKPAQKAEPAAGSFFTPPTMAPAPAAVAAPVETKLGEVLGRPEKTHWTPTEIIHAVTALPSVFGAMLSLQEGHLAAAEMQATLPPELLAYALPKLFSATGEQARQMKLGDPTMVSLIADGHHWAAFKLDKIFFTVMSRKGQLLPLPQLHTIAHEIARQRK